MLNSSYPPRLVETGDYVKVIAEGGKWHNYIYFDEATQYVEEGGAYVKDYKTIVLLDKEKVKRIVLDRDNHKCTYCNKAGHTVLKLVHKNAGGKYTPKNCVCTCQKCFLKKTSVKRPFHKQIIYFVRKLFKNKRRKIIRG